MKVELVHWNPPKPLFGRQMGPLGRLRGRVNNFGDLLGPFVIGELLRRYGLVRDQALVSARLLSVGSVLRLAREGDIVWGTGVNGKSLRADYSFTNLDVRAVRGPLTREFLQRRGLHVPEIFGDPGLLVGHLWSKEELGRGWPKSSLTVVPNLNDIAERRFGDDALDPRRPLAECLARIASSDFVVSSSLHGVIVAESLGIPARLVRSSAEPIFKYDDYFMGSGRASAEPAETVEHAMVMGGQTPPAWDPAPLLRAFPLELWSARINGN